MKETRIISLPEHIIEIVSDSGEGAQKAATSFAEVSAKMGNGLWTVEVIPAEIQPPPHTVGAASGNRIRLADKPVTNAGDRANMVLAFNEMALLSRIEAEALADDVTVIIDNVWAEHEDADIRESYRNIMDGIREKGGVVIEVPMEVQTLTVVEDPFKGKNMFALGVLGWVYQRDPELLRDIVANTFRKKSETVQKQNIELLDLGWAYAEANLDFRIEIARHPIETPQVVMNGNTAIALGAITAGFKLCSMYPITPATSASHALAESFESFGGMVHQAEDEIAAIGVAIGASYAGRTALTITSGPGMALKTEFLGLASMIETPLVIVDVQRGGPSTGLPTKIEQSDLLHALYATPGDAPKIVIAPSTIEECFHIMSTARRLAESFRMPVIVLSDANLATGQQLFPRPRITTDMLPPPLDQNPVPEGTQPFDWDEETGLSRQLIPGQPGGTGMTTGLAHFRDGKIRYDYQANQESHRMRSRKLAALQKTLKPPALYGDEEGDLLVVGWGSTRGVIEEAVDRVRAEGARVSSINIQFLNPLPPGLKKIFSRFGKVLAVELNYSDDWGDPLIDEESRRYSQLALLLRAHTLVDVDCFSRVPGRPFMPSEVYGAIRKELENLNGFPRTSAAAQHHQVGESA
ncbi:MAG: 2-oxoacid:acceptor oxidoreductase subunit alpha [bacterium]